MKDVRDTDPAIGQLNATCIPCHILLGIPDVIDARFQDSFLKLSNDRAAAFANLTTMKGVRFAEAYDHSTEDAIQRT